MAAATAVAGGTSYSLPILADEPESGVQWNKAPCRFCGTGCDVQVGVQVGKVVAVAGDRNAEVNKGLLCVKGYHVGSALYGKDRLTKPLLRDGDGYREISWEEAIRTIADRVEAAPERFAFYGSGQWTIPEGYAAQKVHEGRPVEQPHRPECPAVHGVSSHWISRNVRRRRAGRLLRRS